VLSDSAYLAEAFGALTDTVDVTSPSVWAENNRYLTRSVATQPGYFSWDVTPYLREIIDCLDVRSPVRDVTVMKGAQIGATVGLLENFLGYLIAVVRSAPVLTVTATDELAKLRMDRNVTPMLSESGLKDCIASTDEFSKGKQGKTNKRVSWLGGGYLVPIGAQSAPNLRSMSALALLLDEVDGFPMTVGKEGDPVALAEARTSSYYPRRKVLRLSTPLDAATSKIEAAFKKGDQRYYEVPCLKCGGYQKLVFQKTTEAGEVYGLQWDMHPDNERLVEGSVRYLCKFCQHPHTNSNKGVMMRRGKWVATAEPEHSTYRSYHLSALYSPPGMLSYEGLVLKWLDAWSVAQNRAKDIEKYRAFQNTVLGESFEDRGKKIALATVSAHRRAWYDFGEIPNRFFEAHAGGKAGLVIAAVDVHRHNLRVAVFAFTPGERMALLDYHTFSGETEDTGSPASPWLKLAAIIDDKVYPADDGRRYRVSLTLVDAGYNAATVYEFCAQWESGVLPVKGEAGKQGARLPHEFRSFVSSQGTTAFHINVDFYKDMLASNLRRKWDGSGTMPLGHWSAPAKISDEHLRELTREYKGVKIDKKTNRRVGWTWIRPSGAANELWDLSVYARAGLAIVATSVLVDEYGRDSVHMPDFWAFCESEGRYRLPPEDPAGKG